MYRVMTYSSCRTIPGSNHPRGSLDGFRCGHENSQIRRNWCLDSHFSPNHLFEARCLGGAIEPVLACARKAVLAVVALRPWVWVGRDSLDVVPVGTYFAEFLSLFIFVCIIKERLIQNSHRSIENNSKKKFLVIEFTGIELRIEFQILI